MKEPAGLRRLLSEFRRRKVFRVAGVYAVVAWGAIEIAETTAPLMGLPPWVPKLVLFLLLLGFPVALVLAWAFELTPEGVKRTASPSGRSRAPAYAGLGVLLALVGFGAYAYMGSPAGGSGIEGERSVAVLPFADMSVAGDQAYLSDGITEDILTRLAGIGGLRVISRTSVMQYKNTELSVPEIARDLGVRYVLEGSVRRVGDRVRITGQLIDAASDAHLWAESYDRELTDVFAVQSEIAGEITDALEVRLTEGERERLARRGTASAAAYELHLKGRERLRRVSGDFPERLREITSAIALFREALEADPEYAPAWAGLARAYRMHPGIPPFEAYDSALALSRHAIELDPELPDGYIELGWAYNLKDHNEPQYDQFRAALRLSPNNAEAITGLVDVHGEAGRLDEALRAAQRAAALEPNLRERRIVVADLYARLGSFERAEVIYREHESDPVELHCDLSRLAAMRADTAAVREHLRTMLSHREGERVSRCAYSYHLWLGEYAEAERHLERFLEIAPAGVRQMHGATLAFIARETGRPVRVEALLRLTEAWVREATARSPELESPLARMVHVHVVRGEHDRAVELLEMLYERSGPSYHARRFDPLLADLHGHPGFEALLARMKADLDRMRARVEREEVL